MQKQPRRLSVTHVNIRLSISFLLLKLVLIEVIAATLVVFFMSVSLSDFISRAGFVLPVFTIPLYLFMVFLKTFITIYVVLQWLNEYYEISPENIIHRKGILFRYEAKYPLKHMQIIEVHQSFFGRLLNYGTISVLDSFRTERVDMYQIHNPVRYASILEELLPNEIETIREVRRHVFNDEKPDISVK